MYVTDPLISQLIFISLCYREKVHHNKEFICGNSKPSRQSQITTRSNSTENQGFTGAFKSYKIETLDRNELYLFL